MRQEEGWVWTPGREWGSSCVGGRNVSLRMLCQLGNQGQVGDDKDLEFNRSGRNVWRRWSKIVLVVRCVCERELRRMKWTTPHSRTGQEEIAPPTGFPLPTSVLPFFFLEKCGVNLRPVWPQSLITNSQGLMQWLPCSLGHSNWTELMGTLRLVQFL